MRPALLRCLGVPLSTLLVAALLALPAAAQAPEPPRTLRVATGSVVPFVFERDGIYSGFSIELWSAIAQRLRLQTEFVDTGPRSPAAQLAAVVAGRADVALSNVIVTADREQMVDFSLPYFEGGLQILVSKEDTTHFVWTLLRMMAPALFWALVVGLVLALVLAHIVWLVELRVNPKTPRSYVKGVGEGLWGAMLIVATGEHGDREAPGVVKRITVGGMWLLGVVVVAQFTATMTSALTVDQLRTDIRGPADLLNRRLGSVPDSIGAQWLSARGLAWQPVYNAEQGLAMLARGEVDAIVYNAATLQYWASRLSGGRAEVAGAIFYPEKYAIALPLGSPLRKQINGAILDLIDNGTWEELRQRWFGQAR